MCIYIHIYVYVYTYIYIYINIYMHTNREPSTLNQVSLGPTKDAALLPRTLNPEP